MIRHSDPFDDDDDKVFNNEFQFLREIEPPSSMRSKCLAAANQAVQATSNGSANANAITWRQAGLLASAVAASLLVGISIGWGLRGNSNASVVSGQVVENSDVAPLDQIANAKATSVVHYDERLGKGSFRQEETYLCGVGRIRSKSMIQLNGE